MIVLVYLLHLLYYHSKEHCAFLVRLFYSFTFLSFLSCTSSQRQPQTKKTSTRSCHLLSNRFDKPIYRVAYNNIALSRVGPNFIHNLCIVEHSETSSSSALFFYSVQRNKVTFYCDISLRPVLLKTFAKLLNDHLCLKCNHLCAEILWENAVPINRFSFTWEGIKITAWQNMNTN